MFGCALLFLYLCSHYVLCFLFLTLFLFLLVFRMLCSFSRHCHPYSPSMLFHCDWKSFEQRKCTNFVWMLFCCSCEKCNRPMERGDEMMKNKRKWAIANLERVWIDCKWCSGRLLCLFNTAQWQYHQTKKPKSSFFHSNHFDVCVCVNVSVSVWTGHGELCVASSTEWNQYHWMCRILTKCQEQHTY